MQVIFRNLYRLSHYKALISEYRESSGYLRLFRIVKAGAVDHRNYREPADFFLRKRKYSLDKSLGINWQIPAEKAILSEKDTRHPLLADFETPFIY